MGRTKYRNLYRIRLLPVYEIQGIKERKIDQLLIVIHACAGQEFQAVFMSTTEPIDKDGNTCNPTKSPCDRYVFNTVLTRAKSLVVAVGSPLVLLNTEAHMVKLYGE